MSITLKFTEIILSILKIKEFNTIDIKSTEIILSTLNSLIFNVNGIISADLMSTAFFLWILMSQMLKSAKIILSMLKSKNLMPIILNSQK